MKKDMYKWHRWFAWYPVKTECGGAAAWTFVERRKYVSPVDYTEWWIYRHIDHLDGTECK